jgi:nucleoside-diphosphate-sugar epimerase
MTTLIVGCGYVGSALAERLVSRGEHVLAITRSSRALPEGVDSITATLPDPTLRVPSTIDRLVYAVAPGARDDAAYERAYPLGLASVLDALDRAGASIARAVLVSTTAVYAQDDESLVDESSPVTASGTAARVLEAEAVLRARLGARGITLRLSGIYGPGRDRMVRAIAAGSPPPGDPARISNRIHRDDAAAAIDHLLSLADPAPVYIGTDEAPVPLGEVFAWIAAELGVALAEPTGPTRDGATSKRLRSARLRRSGFTLRFPSFREGYAAAIAEHRRSER